MSKFRDLQAKLEKIDESYYSRLAAAVDDIASFNKNMSDVELVALIRNELGDQAAKYMADKLAADEPIEETFSDWVDDFTAPSDEREHRYDHDPSFHDDEPISAQVKSLLAQGKSVICRIAGASGVVYSANPEDGTIVFKDQNIGEKIGFDVDSKTGLEIKGYVDHYAIVQNVDEGIDEGVGDWIKRLDKKAGKWITGKAEKLNRANDTYAAKKVAELVRDEGIKSAVIHVRYVTGGKGKLIKQALENYLQHSPDGEYAEEVRYVLPALDKEASDMRDAEISAFGAPLGESELDDRGKMCPVCTGGRREGYGNNCPNCGGEGYVEEAVVEVPAGLRGEDAEMGGATSRDAERFLADLASDDSVDTEVIDPESGEVLDWPTKDTRKAQDHEEYLKHADERDKEEEEKWNSIFSTPHIPGGKSAPPGQVQSLDGMDQAMDDLGKLKYDSQITDFYDITWKSIEDLVDEPQQYYDGDYDIGWDMPVVIKRTDGQKFDDKDHANFRRLSSLFRTATYNIGLGYAGAAGGGKEAHFYPSFY